MSTKLKYKSKAVFWNLKTRSVINPNDLEKYRRNGKLALPEFIARFDSQHEFRVYLELVRIYGADRIIRQYPLEIISPGYCYPHGKKWKVDFAVSTCFSRNHVITYVEAKGMFTTEFGYTLAALESHNDTAFSRLRIVFGNSIPTKNRIIKSLQKSDFKRNLLTLKQLKSLQIIP